MGILKALSISYIVIFAILTVFSNKMKLSLSQIRGTFILLALSLAVIAYNMTPGSNWDIVRHSEYMDEIRRSGLSFSDFLFHNKAAVGGSEYADLYVFNILRYFVISVWNNNLLLPAICVFIDYSIVGYIATDWSASTGNGGKVDVLTLLLCLTFMPYFHASTGMRTALCACIMGLAIYLYLYKRKNIFLFVVLALIAISVHPIGIIAIAFVFLAKLNIWIAGFVTVFIVSVSLPYAAKWMSASEIPYLAYIAKKYFQYTSDSQFVSDWVPLLGVLVISAILLLIYFLFVYKRYRSKENSSGKRDIYNFAAIYMVYVLGNVGNYDMVLRPAYLLGALAPVLASFLTDHTIWIRNGLNKDSNRNLRLVAWLVCVLICLFVNFYIFLPRWQAYLL